MIPQLNIYPAGMVINPSQVSTASSWPEGRWQVLEGFRSVAGTFVQSLNPNYDLRNVQPYVGYAAGTDFQGNVSQASHSLPFTALAARAVVAYANLPPEINQALGYLANLVAAGRVASDQHLHCPEIPSPMMVNKEQPCLADTEKRTALFLRDSVTPWQKENALQGQFPDATSVESRPGKHRDKTGKASQNPTQQRNKSTIAMPPASQLPSPPLALGALVGLCAVGTSSASAHNPDWINITNARNLSQICHEAKSCSRNYRLTRDIDGSQLTQSIGNKTCPFTGQLDGGCHTINNLTDCLIKNLGREGHIKDLHFNNIAINSTATAGVAACEMTGGAKISNILVTHANLFTSGDYASAGIAVGSVDGGIVINTNAVNCNVTTKGKRAHAGIGAGQNRDGSVTNTTAINCTVKTSEKKTHAGIGAGQNRDGSVVNTTAINCTVETSKEKAHAGIGAGTSTNSTITDTKAVKCTVSTSKGSTYVGIGAGRQFKGEIVANTTAINCTVKASGTPAYIGIAAGHQDGIVTNTEAFNSTVISADSENINIKQGDSYIICNVFVNNDKQEDVGACQPFTNGFCADFDSTPVKPNCQVANDINPLYVTNSSLISPITACMKPGDTTNFSSPGVDSSSTPLTTAARAPRMTISSPGSTPLATPLTESPSPAFIATFATLGAAIVVLIGVIVAYTHRNRQQRSSTRTGRIHSVPKYSKSRPCANRPLPAIPQLHNQLPSASPGNKTTGGRFSLVNTDSQYDLPMNQSLMKRGSVYNHYEQIPDYEVMVMPTGSSNPMANTDKVSGKPIYQNETFLSYIDDGDYELMADKQWV